MEDIKPLNIPPEIAEKMRGTLATQAADDKAGLQAATSALPGPLKDVWALQPDIEEGPYKIRRFVDGDFIRLAAFGHKLNSFSAVGEWLEKPEPSGKDAWLLNWMMTRSTADVKLAIAAGPEKVIAAAEAEFSELSGMQLAMIMRAIVSQLAVYLGTRVEYKPAETAANGEAASPPQ
jgi:hypothetical protein